MATYELVHTMTALSGLICLTIILLSAKKWLKSMI